ncbi:MAG: glycosyltransferase [Patescibacteria group bacterium]
MEKIKCSVPILTLNSEKFLERCLRSVMDFDDVFLLDGNSTDKTLEIAAKFGVPVRRQAETDEKNLKITDFSAIRIKSINNCRFDWVLWVDSDEFLSAELADEVRNLLRNTNDKKVIYNIQKKYSIGDKKVDFAFNYPNYYPRLHHRGSGAKFKEGKLVHEQMFIPADVRPVNLKYWVYSEVPATYRECVDKDRFQLDLMKKSTFSASSFKARGHSLKISLVYFLRAVRIFFKSMMIYFRYGYGRSLPIGQVMRHVRVHLIMSGWRLIQFARGR